MIQLISNASLFLNNMAIRSNGEAFTYEQLLSKSENIAHALLNGKADLREERIAFLVDPSFDYTSMQWGIWRAGGIAVPLCTKHPTPSLKYVLEDTQASILVYSENYKTRVEPFREIHNLQLLNIDQLTDSFGTLPDVDQSRSAMILYTSGTTGKPKGVVSTHANIGSQISVLVNAWQWNDKDHILNVLPMHHVHGIINVMSCALWSGACCEFLPKFESNKVFSLFSKGEINLFMAVPTIYYKLINQFNSYEKEKQQSISSSLRRFRLMVSGSAALPISVLEQWKTISGQTLLERYGMTEIGMAISNPYIGERKPGYIGQPLPGINIRLVDESGTPVSEDSSGEIQVKGPNVFKEYWQKPQASVDAFDNEGWFKTGDIAIREKGSYRILGRNSIDIIKSGGYKISALEIEEVLRSHPKIIDCGVVGIPDEEWGEIIGASLVCSNKSLDLNELKQWLIDKLPRYKLPRKYLLQDDLPRNVMGKVTKKAIVDLFKS